MFFGDQSHVQQARESGMGRRVGEREREREKERERAREREKQRERSFIGNQEATEKALARERAR